MPGRAPPDDSDSTIPPTLPPDTLSPQSIHNLITPLTIIKGQTQLMQRRLRQMETADGERLLAGLAAIEAAATVLAAQVKLLRRSPSPDDQHDPS